MELWLDTFDQSLLKQARDAGLLHGVTSNPNTVAQAGIPLEELIDATLDLFEGPLAVQVVGREVDTIMQQARSLHAVSDRIIVKVPVTARALPAIYRLGLEGIPVMATSILEPKQVLLACKAGATYAAFYYSSFAKGGGDAYSALETMLKIVDGYGFHTELLCCATNKVEDVTDIAAQGAHAVTMSGPVFSALLQENERVSQYLDFFDNAWDHAAPTRLLPNSEPLCTR